MHRWFKVLSQNKEHVLMASAINIHAIKTEAATTQRRASRWPAACPMARANKVPVLAGRRIR
jgi:hypothetical protein